MSINGQVYDFTAYLPGHPADPAVIQPWVQRDASEAYRARPAAGRTRPTPTLAAQVPHRALTAK